MASFGTVLDLLDDRYLGLQDVTGNVEPLPTLVPYEEYSQNVLVYRMDTSLEIFMGMIQDFTMRRAAATRQELWTWLVQWEVDNTQPTQQLLSPKKARLDASRPDKLSKSPLTPRQSPALTILERRTLDGALMLEEEMIRILIDIVQAASSLVPNFIEFLYRWIDYYEGDGKALKAALASEIPSLWEFEYHPLLLPPEEMIEAYKSNKGMTDGQWDVSAGNSDAAELRQSSPTKKMRTLPKPDLAEMELRALYTEESERLNYREVKFGIQPPKLEQPLPPLINIPRDYQKRFKYYTACFKSRQRALYLLVEAGLSSRQVSNYQKGQTAHPKETSGKGDGNGLRNYHKDAKFAQAHFQLREKQMKQREIAISNRLAVEAELAASNAVPDGASGLPLIPPTPSHVRRTGMEASLLRKLREMRAKNKHKINIVPKPLVGRLKSKVFENAEAPIMANSGCGASQCFLLTDLSGPEDLSNGDDSSSSQSSSSSDSDSVDGDSATAPATTSDPPRLPLLRPLPPRPPTIYTNAAPAPGGLNILPGQTAPIANPTSSPDQSIPPNIAAYIQNLTVEQAQRLVPLVNAQRERLLAHSSMPQIPSSSTAGNAVPSSSGQPGYITNPSNLTSLPQTSQMQQISASYVSTNQASGTSSSFGAYQRAEPNSASPPTDPLMLPALRSQGTLSDRPHLSYLSASGAQDAHNQSSYDPRQYPAAEGSHSTTPYPPLYNIMASHFSAVPPPPPGFEADYFRNLQRQQQAAQTATTSYGLAQSDHPVLPLASLTPRPPPMTFPHPPQQALGWQVLPADLAAMSAQAHPTENEAGQSTTQQPRQPEVVRPEALATDQSNPAWLRGLGSSVPTLRPIVTFSPPSPQQLPQAQLSGPHSQMIGQAPADCSSASTLHPPSTSSMLPLSRPGIARNAPSPIPIAPHSPSAFTTFGPQVLATSPFLPSSPTSRKPIQIYFPKIMVPGNGIGPGGAEMGNKGCIETDALMLGYEDVKTGSLLLTRAILLPMGVWENTLRRARGGHWTILETYANPLTYSEGSKGKGKEKAAESASSKGCHRAVYDKLAQAYGMITTTPKGREEELTKRWRVTRGPMMSCDRGAVWEGWGVYVDRGIEMSASEREDALKLGEKFWPYKDVKEAERRRKEIDELIEEDDDNEGNGMEM
ncbi:hypothetical protein SVAN01_06265 [Stagonosporopsis vannaccii]|nr:hypothetical protein SVAN01_06265 [Stagonosporopsis vannaccii]